MQFSIPHATTPGLTATTTVETKEAVNAGGLQSTIQTSTAFTNFKNVQAVWPDTRNLIQGPGGLTASGSNT